MITTNIITVRLLLLVKDQLSNTYICSSDNYFVENPFEQYIYRGYYSTIFAEGQTDEYCAIEDSNHTITNIKIGGEILGQWWGTCILTVHLARNSKKY